MPFFWKNGSLVQISIANFDQPPVGHTQNVGSVVGESQNRFNSGLGITISISKWWFPKDFWNFHPDPWEDDPN